MGYKYLRFEDDELYTTVVNYLNSTNDGVLNKMPDIEKVIFNDGHTIILWSDKTKTVVACQNGEKFDSEKGFALAFMKKYFGNTGKYFNIVKKWCGEPVFHISEKVGDISFSEKVDAASSLLNFFRLG